MKKRKLKGSVKLIIVLIILSACGFGCYKLGYLDTVLSYFDVNNVIKVKEPILKLKIVDEESDSRVIAVSINNNHDAWPHYGLQESYLNYELIAEGGITRILAFFKDSKAERIGSVRSTRHYFLDYIMENDAIFVHYGHSSYALSDISKYDIDSINGMYTSTPFWRDKSLNKAYEHTAFTSMEKINSTIKSKKIKSTSDASLLFKYSPAEISLSEKDKAKEASKVSIVYSDYQVTTYEYDEETKLYKQSMSKVSHVDGKTKKQYTAKNIITYQVKNSSIDSYGRQELDNVGSGTGYYITDGYSVPIKWSKKSRKDKTIYTYENGEELVLNDGNTWIHIQPKGKTLSIK